MNFPAGKEIYRIQSEQQTIIVSQDKDLRLLRVDTQTVQSAMSLQAPHKLILSYMELMMSFLLFQRRPGKMLMLGLGGGDMVRYLHHILPKTSLQIVESDSAMIHVCQEYFLLPKARNIEITAHPAEQFMARSRHKYDTLLVDIYSHIGTTSPLLLDARFYELCHMRLRNDGVMVMNLIAENADQFRHVLWEIRQCFERQTLCLTVAGHNNVIIIAFKQKPALLTQPALLKKARKLSTDYGLDFSAVVGNLFVTNPLANGELILG
ncbi:MAG: fused MFS/spermidine synthase [Gammaproteobacteria bacterium]|nr:fused MFS/spermidine synthase [Gammaproteobacteria bacterium]